MAYSNSKRDNMALYQHHINNHRRSKRAGKFKRVSLVLGILILLGGVGVGVDWLITNIRATKTVTSIESSATVQSARINIFQTPYYRFQADSSWREVTDELNLGQSQDGSKQFLYRSYDKNFIEHELWVTVNLPREQAVVRHNVPTRVLPVSVGEDGSILPLDVVSDPCVEVLPKENPNLEIQTVTQKDISYLCNPNQVNDYTVTAGVPGKDNRILVPQKDGERATLTIVYRNITASPDSRQLESILNTFKTL